MRKTKFYSLLSITSMVIFMGSTIASKAQTFGSALNLYGDFESTSPAIFPMPNPPASPTDYAAGTWYRTGSNVAKANGGTTPTYAIDGLQSVAFTGGTSNDAVIYQRTTGLTANTTYRVIATARMQNIAGAVGTTGIWAQGYMYITIKGGTYWVGTNPNLGNGISFSTATNTTKSYEFNTGSNTDIIFQAAVWKSSGGYGYLDDVFIQQKLTTLITTSAADPTMGTVTASGTVTCDQSTSVTATPNTGYSFVNWTENGTVVSTSATYTFTASADRVLVANFVSNTTTAVSNPSKENEVLLSVNNGKICVSGQIAPDARLNIFNTTGQLIYSTALQSNNKQLNVNLPAGIYLTTLTNAGKTSIKKIILN